MKISKEVKTGFFAILSITLLILGINFLKGSSFFGGDDTYYAYFTNSSGVTPASPVVVNGVEVGKIMEVRLTNDADSLKKVRIKFNVQVDNFRIPKSSKVTVGSIELLSKGLIIEPGFYEERQGEYKPGDEIMGYVAVDIIDQVKLYVEPVNQKLQALMASVDDVIGSISAFWDTSATSSIEMSLDEVRIAIHRFGVVAEDIEQLIKSEKVRISNIFANAESITQNLKESNEKIASIIGNVDKITEDLVSADFKKVINTAEQAINNLSDVLNDINDGKGTLGKLAKDDKLYNELVKSNKSLQDLLNDLELHPERYVHFSLFGKKSKGVVLKPSQEEKLIKILDSIPD